MGRIPTFVAGIVLALGLVLAPPARAQKADDADALNTQVVKLYAEGKYAEAVPIAIRPDVVRALRPETDARPVVEP